jgi:uncharacterized protein (DUF2147 family)
MHEWVVGIVSGIISGIIAAFLYSMVAMYWISRLRRKLSKRLAGTYEVRAKFGGEPIEVVEVDVDGKVVRYRCEHGSDGGQWSGYFVLADSDPYTSMANYQHFRDKEHLWGIHQFLIDMKEDMIYVHTIYADRSHKMVMKGYVWEKKSQKSEPG